jgi:sialate O-acetylesterase
MEFTIRQLGGMKQFKEEFRKHPVPRKGWHDFRLCRVPPVAAEAPADSCRASWLRANPATIPDFSATAYFFGKMLYDSLRVPVGLILASLGGSPVEAWTPATCRDDNRNLSSFLQPEGDSVPDIFKPSALYNGMIHPLLNYPIRGAIWYQGESNITNAGHYRELFSTMVRCWRDGWNQRVFPFYFVQIAPFRYENSADFAAYLREAQQQSLALQNTGMVVTMDIGDVNDIHPVNKPEVGRRLALLALNRTYGFRQLICGGPVFSHWEKEESAARLFFDHAPGGLISGSAEIRGFFLAGKEGEFYPVKAVIDSNTVVLKCDRVSSPSRIRYAFSDTAIVNIFNHSGLPLAPFRTDTLPFFNDPVRIQLDQDSIPGSTILLLTSADRKNRIHFTLDGSIPGLTSPAYTGPVKLDSTVQIRALAFRDTLASARISQADFIMHDALFKPIRLEYPYSPKYKGGKHALLDGIRGSTNFMDKRWQGYRGTDFSGIVDLGSLSPVSSATIGFLHCPDSWIFLPVSVDFYTSADGVEYKLAGAIHTSESWKAPGPFIKDYTWTASGEGETLARYIKIVAKNTGVCPRAHPGRGEKAWLFADEIMLTTKRPDRPNGQPVSKIPAKIKYIQLIFHP